MAIRTPISWTRWLTETAMTPPIPAAAMANANNANKPSRLAVSAGPRLNRLEFAPTIECVLQADWDRLRTNVGPQRAPRSSDRLGFGRSGWAHWGYWAYGR